MYYVIIAILLNFGTPVQAVSWDARNFGWDKIGTVQVDILDQISGACWTNLRESREYVEEKLRSKGVRLRENGPWGFEVDYFVIINAAGSRAADGQCSGAINVQLFTVWVSGKFMHKAVALETSNVFTNPNNANRFVIQAIQELFE